MGGKAVGRVPPPSAGIGTGRGPTRPPRALAGGRCCLCYSASPVVPWQTERMGGSTFQRNVLALTMGQVVANKDIKTSGKTQLLLHDMSPVIQSNMYRGRNLWPYDAMNSMAARMKLNSSFDRVYSLSKAHGIIPNVLLDPKCKRCTDLLDDWWSPRILPLLDVIVAKAPCSCRTRAISLVSVTTPVTLLHAEKDPSIGLRAYSGEASARRSAATSTSPSPPAPISTTSARLRRHDSRLEWCSYGPTKTTHRSSARICAAASSRPADAAGAATPITSCRRLMAAVVPAPQKSSASRGPAPMHRRT
ncbi:hypothetical protein U9M48_035267 [Paspalum notatum var. saurae]|uniref:Uncharacterized protein n=1 Tax=Paspalum notatum var. saurae TaxID=547442 RepID=A0AAQ3UGM1_PASNO